MHDQERPLSLLSSSSSAQEFDTGDNHIDIVPPGLKIEQSQWMQGLHLE
jgi:hypothetical protein